MNATAVNQAQELHKEFEARLRLLPYRNTPALRGVRREFTRRLKKAEPQLLLKLAQAILEHCTAACRFMGYELILHHPPAAALLTPRRVEALGRGMDSWGAVDCFACYIAGPAWRAGRVKDALIHRWARSPDRWWRRAALVSTVPLNNKARGGSGDARRTLAVCRLLLGDRDDMVVKALSWALRELAKRDAASVQTFLNNNAAALPARVLREVRHKLTTGLKNPRRTRK